MGVKFQIPIGSGVPDSKSQDSRLHDTNFLHSGFNKINFLDSGFHKQNFPVFQIPLHGAIFTCVVFPQYDHSSSLFMSMFRQFLPTLIPLLLGGLWCSTAWKLLKLSVFGVP